MEEIFNEIRGLHDAGFYFSAIALATALPDICASLRASPNANPEKQKSRYLRWYNEFVRSPVLENLTANDIYSIRCGVLHQGTFGNKNMQFERVAFMLPNKNIYTGVIEMGPPLHDPNRRPMIAIPSEQFCEALISCCEKWYEDHRNDADVKTNLDRLVRYRKDGITPFAHGIEMIG